MPRRPQLSPCWLVLCWFVACSGELQAPDADGQALAGRTAGGAAGSFNGAGRGGDAVAGTSGATAGTLGEGGDGAGGEVSLSAAAVLTPVGNNTLGGSVTFVQHGDEVVLSLALSACSEGKHAIHLHTNASCADSANAAGGHWSPQGEIVPDVTCGADGIGMSTFAPALGVWSIGGRSATNVLGHAVIVHAGPSGAEAGARLACGIPTKLE